jgi:hypothetical protein
MHVVADVEEGGIEVFVVDGGLGFRAAGRRARAWA